MADGARSGTGRLAAVRNFLFVDDAGLVMLHGGALTGPMMDLSRIGSAVLLIGACVQMWWRKIGGSISILGLAMMLPLFSWFFSSGLWCRAGHCYGPPDSYPLFTLHGFSAVTLVLALASITLQWRPRHL
jgi:hypothetical protein